MVSLEDDLAAYSDASLAYVPCVEMHDTKARSCWILVSPCYIPFQPHTVVEEERSCCKIDVEILDVEIHGVESRGEEIHDETWAAESEDPDCPGQTTESLD